MEKQKQEKRLLLSPGSKKSRAVKVVYISNPMKIKASPSEFRAVVQQLTGRYATGSFTTNKLDNLRHELQEVEDDRATVGDLQYQYDQRNSDVCCYESAPDFISITQQMQQLHDS
ncbi:hypothetical protein QVD17_17784 [Tagetes erecta]|uniref:VQ domain-containing protein n=1 Tax=Tagetes erecta TaxID=13708 RepID=A0AAD8P1R5_TARER|nr:hypothetical protein QVD17_17784 [Tagetes erecta]